MWQQLFVNTPGAEWVAETMISALSGLGFTQYDPFPGGSGTPVAFKTFARHFVAPASDNWVRILGQPLAESLPALIAALSKDRAVMSVELDETEGRVLAYVNGQPRPLEPFLRLGFTLSEPDREPAFVRREKSSLPPELENLARQGNVNPEQASKLMNRLTGQIFGKLNRQSGGEANAMRNEAQAMLTGSAIDWTSSAARRLTATVESLRLPENWREPSLEVLKDAYQVARRLRKNPKASLMADEKQALDAVPNAGDYLPVYMGRA